MHVLHSADAKPRCILESCHIGRYLNGNGEVLWTRIQGSTVGVHTPRNPVTYMRKLFLSLASA